MICDISETVQDTLYVSVDITNRKSYIGFPVVPKSVTLNDLERRYGPLWPFFGVFSPKTLLGFGANCVNVAEARPILSATKM